MAEGRGTAVHAAHHVVRGTHSSCPASQCLPRRSFQPSSSFTRGNCEFRKGREMGSSQRTIAMGGTMEGTSSLEDTGSKMGRERPGAGGRGSRSLRKDAASPRGSGEIRSPRQKGWVSLAAISGHPSPRKTQQIPLMPAQPQIQTLQGSHGCRRSWDISKRRHINCSGLPSSAPAAARGIHSSVPASFSNQRLQKALFPPSANNLLLLRGLPTGTDPWVGEAPQGPKGTIIKRRILLTHLLTVVPAPGEKKKLLRCPEKQLSHRAQWHVGGGARVGGREPSITWKRADNWPTHAETADPEMVHNAQIRGPEPGPPSPICYIPCHSS